MGKYAARKPIVTEIFWDNQVGYSAIAQFASHALKFPYKVNMWLAPEVRHPPTGTEASPFESLWSAMEIALDDHVHMLIPN